VTPSGKTHNLEQEYHQMRGQGEGSVYQLTDGRWMAQVDAGRYPNGRRRFLRKTANSKRDATRLLSDLKRDAGIPAARDRITVAIWCGEWLNDVRAKVAAGQMAPKTAVGYESDVRRHIVPAVGQVRLDQLAPGHVDRMMTGMQAAGLSPRTAASARATLSSALSAAVADGLINGNPARAAKPPAKLRRHPSTFSDAELDAIVEQCRTARLGPAFMVDATTGLRTSELIGLSWGDVDLVEGTYRVTEGLHRIGRVGAAAAGVEPGLVASKPKTAASGDLTPLSKEAVEWLRRWRKTQAADRLAAGERWVESGRVFTTPHGTPVDPANLRKDWIELLAAAGVADVTADGRGRGLHELRRTFATRLRAAGVPLEDVMRLGRWASPTTLLAHYAGVDEDRLRAAADAAGAGIL
jgi:integrase